MKRSLTKMMELTTMILVGQTEAGSVEVQPARDSQLNAMNCRWGGRLIPAIPFCRGQSQFSVLTCLKKPNKKSPAKGGFLITEENKKWTCPVHAEPVQFFLRSRARP